MKLITFVLINLALFGACTSARNDLYQTFLDEQDEFLIDNWDNHDEHDDIESFNLHRRDLPFEINGKRNGELILSCSLSRSLV
jgi:hypothetical protein